MLKLLLAIKSKGVNIDDIYNSQVAAAAGKNHNNDRDDDEDDSVELADVQRTLSQAIA